jgi:PAS domain S-box-containing protein
MPNSSSLRCVGAGLAFTAQVAATELDFVAALTAFRPDIIIVDYRVPGFGGFEAARTTKLEAPDTPVILVTGVLRDEAAAELLKTGISDYVLKDHMARLPNAVIGALRDAEATRERRRVQLAHDELACIVECAKDGVIGVNAADVVTAWNTSAERIYGTSAERAIGQPLRKALQAGYSRALRHALGRVRSSGQAMSLETKYRATSGKVLALSLSFSAIHADDGMTPGAPLSLSATSPARSNFSLTWSGRPRTCPNCYGKTFRQTRLCRTKLMSVGRRRWRPPGPVSRPSKPIAPRPHTSTV